ncbi:bifunctional diguanylate cyclase/phosphodiesterase [Thioalkalivibrio paradoxus]|uniref:bifunctional diguanylate cyclase/phosphodiesterase n=1 Tax=Thioalkalivibrio paradoxus TaxID=108010 RepID=UPI001E57711E|nr:EAL domain-containing protein [Thioalkalivibrio paradoxus]
MDERRALRTALWVAGLYGLVALLWVLYSDHLILTLANGDAARLGHLQSIKGGVFVTVTALMLFLLVRQILVHRAEVTRDARRLGQLIDRSPLVGLEWRGSDGWPVTFVSANIREWGHDPLELTSGRLRYIDLVHPDDCARRLADVSRHLARGTDRFRQEYRLKHGDGHWLWIDDHTTLIRDGKGGAARFQSVLTDVTAQVADRLMEAARVQVFSELASDRAVEELLVSICVRLEAAYPGLRAAILLRDEDDESILRFGAAPSLPEGLVVRIAESTPGPCAHAVASGQAVYLDDLDQGPVSQSVVEAAREAGCRACWAVPFRDGHGRAIGALAAFGRERRGPTDREAKVLGEFASIAGLAVDKGRSVQMLREREHALQMVAALTLNLLREDDVVAVIDEALAELGAIATADRVYVFEQHSDPTSGRPVCSQRHEWVREGVTPQLQNPELQNVDLPTTLPRWHEHLLQGELVKGFVRDFPVNERQWLEPQEIASVLVVPILVEGRFWGFLGFDAVTRNRAWSRVEEHVLRIIAASIGAAIERRRAAEGQRRAAAVIESTRDGVMITDLSPRIVSVNPAFTQITGYDEEEVVGQNPRFLQSGRHGPDFYLAMWKSLRNAGHWRGEIWNRRRDGKVYPQWLSISRVLDEHGRPIHYTGVFTDISEIKRTEEQLQHLAHHDPLTDLPNRLLAQVRLEQAIARARRNRYQVAVLFLDLDRFKTINDSLGHPVGDHLLVEVAKRLAGRLREQDTLARLGGDEFLLILEQPRDPEAAGQLADVLLKLLEQPFVIENGRELFVSASIGISLFPDDATTVTELIQHADAAMYQAKSRGRNTYQFYTAALTRLANLRLSMEARLRRAIERNELLLHYQPQVDLATGTPVGVEALVRWQSSEGRIVPPGEFIPIAEDSGLIVPLGYWVLREACTQGRSWLDAGRPPMRLAVNLSALQWQHKDLLKRIQAILDETGFPAEQLEFEITETTLMEGGGPETGVLVALRDLGVRVAIDDFGTGYSSLAALKRFPVDVLKIDRAFVDGLPDDPDDQEITSAIIAMARSLHLEPVAEGVETRAQRDFLLERGCRTGQGFLFARPLPVGECVQWLARALAGEEPVS